MTSLPSLPCLGGVGVDGGENVGVSVQLAPRRLTAATVDVHVVARKGLFVAQPLYLT